MSGIIGYVGVVFFLIKSLMGGGLMYVSVLWEAMITILGSLVAYFYFNERFDHWVQYLGIALALLAAILVHYGGNLKK
jgi:multidrug transporter EmrE-like cation transporter